jgi:hypothetical protein
MNIRKSSLQTSSTKIYITVESQKMTLSTYNGKGNPNGNHRCHPWYCRCKNNIGNIKAKVKSEYIFETLNSQIKLNHNLKLANIVLKLKI